MLSCIRLIEAGANLMSIDQFSEEDQRTLRGMFPSQETQEEIIMHGAHPNLKLQPVLYTTMEVQNAGRGARLEVFPEGMGLADLDKWITQEVPKDKQVAILDTDRARPIGPSFSVIFPTSEPSWSKRLEWSQQINRYLQEEIDKVRTEYKDISDRLVRTLKVRQPDLYKDSSPSAKIRYSELNDRDQHNLAQLLHMQNRDRFADREEARSFLTTATTTSQSTAFTLKAGFLRERGRNHAGVLPIFITFRCPVDP